MAKALSSSMHFVALVVLVRFVERTEPLRAGEAPNEGVPKVMMGDFAGVAHRLIRLSLLSFDLSSSVRSASGRDEREEVSGWRKLVGRVCYYAHRQ